MLHRLRGNEVFLPFQTRTQTRHQRFADAKAHETVHIVRLFQYLGRFFFYNTHYIVHERIFKGNRHILIYRFSITVASAIACAAAVR